MNFSKSLLPDPVTYFEVQGLSLEGRGEWRTTKCLFHGGSDSMRINVKSGGWICMSCGAKGGDVLAFHMESHCMDFVSAAKDLGAWALNRHPGAQRPLPFVARDALGAIRFEALLCAIAACNLARGTSLTDSDRERLVLAAGRIEFVAREVAL